MGRVTAIHWQRRRSTGGLGHCQSIRVSCPCIFESLPVHLSLCQCISGGPSFSPRLSLAGGGAHRRSQLNFAAAFRVSPRAHHSMQRQRPGCTGRDSDAVVETQMRGQRRLRRTGRDSNARMHRRQKREWSVLSKSLPVSVVRHPMQPTATLRDKVAGQSCRSKLRVKRRLQDRAGVRERCERLPLPACPLSSSRPLAIIQHEVSVNFIFTTPSRQGGGGPSLQSVKCAAVRERVCVCVSSLASKVRAVPFDQHLAAVMN